jgi:proteic killer suppression protein
MALILVKRRTTLASSNRCSGPVGAMPVNGGSAATTSQRYHSSLALAMWVMAWYSNPDGRGMILSFRDDWLHDFFVNDVRSKKIAADLEDRLFRKIQLIDDATTDSDLRSPPSNHFEKLRGHLDGFHSIRVNKRWRLIFRWDGGRGEARDVYLDDHSYE